MKIERDKRLLNFKKGSSALYKQWRNAIKAHMTAKGFTTRREAGDKKWAILTEYALTLQPLSQRADVYGSGTAAGIAMQQAVANLLADVGKKLKDTQNLYGAVNLVDAPMKTEDVRKGTFS